MCCRTIGCAAIVLTSIASTAIGEGLDKIPSPRPNGWTTDLTGRLGSATVRKLDALGDAVAGDKGSELAVVVIQSTDGNVPRQFATDLFNRWEIGSREEDDGVLVFVALRDRKAEIILGDGVDDPRQVGISQRIMDDTMLPLFRQDDPEQAVLQGARRCAVEILGVDLEGAGVSIMPLAAPMAAAPRARPNPARLGGDEIPWNGILGVGGVLGTGGAWIGTRRYLRHRPRKCPRCQVPMARLDEAGDNAHLSKSERTEERIGSVDYDVWSCPTCKHVLKLKYGAFFTSYSSCPKCKARTKNKTSRTVRSATRYSTGLERIKERCQHCSYRNSYDRVIPRLPPPRNTSSSSSYSSSSGFSGGSSSGRGASGSW